MKDLKVDESGDLALSAESGDLQYVDGDELIRQKVRLILGTNKTEWEFNKDEGINFFVLLAKEVDEQSIYNAILDGLRQVDEDLAIDEMSIGAGKASRELNIKFRASGGGLASSTDFLIGTTGGDINIQEEAV